MQVVEQMSLIFLSSLKIYWFSVKSTKEAVTLANFTISRGLHAPLWMLCGRGGVGDRGVSWDEM